MAGDEIEANRSLVIGVELGPVHCNDQLLPRTDDELDPWLEQAPDVNLAVAQQAIQLFCSVLRIECCRGSHPSPDSVNAQRRGMENTDHSHGEGQNRLGMKVVPEDPIHHREDTGRSELGPLSSLLSHRIRSLGQSCCCHHDAWTHPRSMDSTRAQKSAEIATRYAGIPQGGD